MIAASGTLNFYREPGRLRLKPVPFESGAKRIWDGRFILAFAPINDSSMTVRQLGADGWLSFRKVMKERGLPLEANRLAALTTPALWKGNRLVSAPLLRFSDAERDVLSVKPIEAALTPSFTCFLAGALTGVASVLGKDTPIPYL